MRRLRFVLVMLVTALVAGIVAAVLAWSGDATDAATDGDGESSVLPAPELTATAEIRRAFARPGLVVIAVTNHGDEPVHVSSAELDSESFEPTGPQQFDATVPPGPTPRDLQVEYGTARCPDGVGSEVAPARVTLVAQVEGGTDHELVLELPYPNGTLDRLLRTDCRTQLLQRSVTLELGPLTPAADGTLTGVLAAIPVVGGASSAAITDVRGSVLFTVRSQPDPALPPGQLRLQADTARCGGHAIGDAKQPYAFTAWIDLGDGEPIPATVPVDAAHRAALDAMQAVRCPDQDGVT